jgi:hypothetical protein
MNCRLELKRIYVHPIKKKKKKRRRRRVILFSRKV